MYKLTLTLIMGLLICSSMAQVNRMQYYYFGKQITPSGKYIIYNYARSGDGAYNSMTVGTELFKISENFVENYGEKISGAMSEWISNDTLLVYDFNSDLKQPKDTFPIKTEYQKLGDFVIKRVYYKSNSSGTDRYEFDSVRLSNDSIIVRIITEEKEHQILKFPLGGTSIFSTTDSIKVIEVSNRITKGMNFIYRNPDGTFSSGLPEVGIMYYELTPARKISPKELIKRKVFWAE